MKFHVIGSALALATLASGCQQEFRPVSDERSTRTGFEAAEYDLKVNDEDVGDARVRSSGAPRDDVLGFTGGKERLLEIGLRIRNDSDAPMRLDLSATQLELRTEDDRMFVIERSVRPPEHTEVAPRTTRRFVMFYALPAGVELDDVAGYELLWAVETANGRVSRSTAFVKDRVGGYPGYYRPYSYGGLGYPGYGYGLYPGIGTGWYGYYW